MGVKDWIKKLNDEIIDLTKEMFSKNMGEIEGFRAQMIILASLGGLLGGGLLGFAGVKGREVLEKKKKAKWWFFNRFK